MATGRAVIPDELKSIQTYLIRANEIQSKSPLISYYCRAFAAECGISLLQKGQLKEESKKYLIELMNQLEKDKQELNPNLEEGGAIVEIFALKLFKKADDADRQGIYDQNVAKLYKASADLMEVTKQFGSLSDDIIEKQKYAKWRAYEISKAIRLGTEPAPIPGLNETTSSELDESLPIHPQSSTTATTTTTTTTSNFTTNYSTSDDDLFKEFDAQNSSSPTSKFSPQTYSTTQASSSHSKFINTPQTHNTPKHSTPTAKPTPSVVPKQAADDMSDFDSPTTDGISLENIMKAQKLAKQAVSALQFSDVQSAKNSLKQALECLQ